MPTLSAATRGPDPMPDDFPRRDPLDRVALDKVAAVTLAFWVLKILATTLGETAGDFLSMTLGLGYGVGLAHHARPARRRARRLRAPPRRARGARADLTQTARGGRPGRPGA